MTKALLLAVIAALLAGCASARPPAVPLFPIFADQRCGYADREGTVVIPRQFEDCGAFAEGLAPVEAGGRWGYLDASGRPALGPQYIAADAFSEGLAFVTTGSGSKVVVDPAGRVLFEAGYPEHRAFHEGLAAVRSGSRWGFIDRIGRLAIPPATHLQDDFHDGLAQERDGFVARDGREVIETTAGASGFADGLAAVETAGRWGYIDSQDATAIHPIYESAHRMSEGRGLVRADGKYGYVDRAGIETVPPSYDQARPYADGMAAVRRGDRWGYLDVAGRVAIPLQYDFVQSFDDGRALVARDSRLFWIDRAGTRLAAPVPSLAIIFQRLQASYLRPAGAFGDDGPVETVAPLLALYKEQLRELAAAALARLPDADPPTLKAAIERGLDEADILRSAENGRDARPYGRIAGVTVLKPSAQPGLLAVTIDVALSETSDTMLAVFGRGSSGWQVVFRLDQDDYAIADAPFYATWEIRAFHLDPPEFTRSDDAGGFMMLLVSLGGLSGDSGNLIRADLYRFGADLRSRRLFHQEYGDKYRDQQHALDDHGFRLETLDFGADTLHGCCRIFAYRYRVAGDQVTRVAPIALSAHDFVEEWGSLPWAEAARWSSPGRSASLQAWHDKLRRKDGYFGGDLPATKRCGAERWQVELDPDSDDPSVFFVLERRGAWDFMLDDIRTAPLHGCKAEPEAPGYPTMFETPLGG